MSPTRRALPAFVLVLGLLALILPLFMHRADASTPAEPVLTPAADFATDTWSDPWDFSNPEDMLLDRGPTWNLNGQSIAGGVMSFTISANGSFSPLWPGFAGSLYLGRDGESISNSVRTYVYTRLHMHVYVSQPVSGTFEWFTCNPATISCEGAMQAGLVPGWNDVDLPIANNNGLLPNGKPWSGRIPSVRYEISPHAYTKFYVDSIRLYQPSTASRLSWTTSASSAQLWWYDSTAFTANPSQHGGPVNGAVAHSGSTTVTDLSGYMPGSHFFAVQPDGTSTEVGMLDANPLPVVDSPSVAGCGDYATTYVGHPWTFARTSWLVGWANMTNISFSSSLVLTATNAGPQMNDPHFWLPMGSAGIDGRVYHRLTITEAYNGPFNLANTPGGGTMARLMWQSAGQTQYAQSDDIITYSGKRTIALDLATPASTLTDPTLSSAQRYAFASSARVMKVRYDPNEDPGARTWQVMSVRLGADCSTSSTFAFTWHDSTFAPGRTAHVWAISSTGSGTMLGTATEQSGTNTFTVNASALAAGQYLMRVDVTTPNGTTQSAYSGSPLFIK